jgi:hypothetical protein
MIEATWRAWQGNIQIYLKETCLEAWAGLIWLRRGTGVRHFLTRQGTFRFHEFQGFVKKLKNSLLLKDLVPRDLDR